MKKHIITTGQYDLVCAKLQFLENENSRLKGYIEGLKEKLNKCEENEKNEYGVETCPKCGSYEWYSSTDKVSCFDCGFEIK